MKNLFIIFALVFSTSIFGQSVDTMTFYEPFLQLNDTLILTGIQPNEVKIELAEYASNVGVKTEILFKNEKVFTDEQKTFVIKTAIAESIEEKCKVVSRLDHFRNKNIQLGGVTPQIERQVTVYVKANTTLIYAN